MPPTPSICRARLLWCHLLHVLSWDFVHSPPPRFSLPPCSPGGPRSLPGVLAPLGGSAATTGFSLWWELGAAPGGTTALPRMPSLVPLPGSWAGYTGLLAAVLTASLRWGGGRSWNLVIPHPTKTTLASPARVASRARRCSKPSTWLLTARSPPCAPSAGSEQAGACLPVLSYPAELAGALTLPFPPLPWRVGDLPRSKVGVPRTCNPNSQTT